MYSHARSSCKICAFFLQSLQPMPYISLRFFLDVVSSVCTTRLHSHRKPRRSRSRQGYLVNIVLYNLFNAYMRHQLCFFIMNSNYFYYNFIFSTLLLSLLCDFMKNSETSQQQMIQGRGFYVVSYLLEKVQSVSNATVYEITLWVV